jgi:hypothetical protein
MSRSQHLSRRPASRRNPSGKSTISHSTRRSDQRGSHTPATISREGDADQFRMITAGTRTGGGTKTAKIPTRVYPRREIKPETEILRISRAFSHKSRGSIRSLLVNLDRETRAARMLATTGDDAEIGVLSGIQNWGLGGWVGVSPHWAIPATEGGEGGDGRRRCGRGGGGGRGERRRKRSATSAVLEPGEDAAGI